MHDKRKTYMSIDFDLLEPLFDSLNESQIKDVLYAVTYYDIFGEPLDIEDINIKFACNTLYRNIDKYTQKAIKSSEAGKKAALKRWSKDKSFFMSDAEMDADIDAQFPRTKKRE